ncbi:snRNA-activating protein complex subunit 1-like [Hippoglossus stenolepis]|uniref:snRNA-activating protein complex subunit 1-like n=1 Tax=Hippoglossus stenolepis TaxID=195615 RepID=UPI001FAF9B58|nr:snRNA-activating protein complex subunit 1-like [Hippoglossus stenolepis]
MPRLPPIYTDFFFHPLTEDVEELLARFQHADSVRYEVFSAIWRNMGLSDVFLGCAGVSEKKRFSRVTLATAMKYFLSPYSYQIRVGGLYLMFGFYHTQPAVPPVKIRLALQYWDQVQKFLKDSVEAGHHDVLYIYKKLVSIKAIHYTAMPHFLSFIKQRKPKKEPVCAGFLGRATAVQELVSADFLEEMTNVQAQYETLKEATVEVSSQVTMTQQDFASHLKDTMSEFLTWQQKTFSQNGKDKNSGDDEEDEKPDEESSSRARLLCSIKNKSYSGVQEVSKARRHRQTQVVESSRAEHNQETGASHKKRPPSLRARTRQNLRVVPEKNKLNAWLLTAPEKPTGDQ